MKKKLLAAAIASSMVLGLSACSDSNNDDLTPPPTPETRNLTVTVVDPLATGCIVTMGDQTAIAGTVAGSYVFTNASAGFNGQQPVKATQCVDSLTGANLPDLESDGLAADDDELVTPVTTVYKKLLDKGLSEDAAKQKVADFFGLSADKIDANPTTDLEVAKASARMIMTYEIIKKGIADANPESFMDALAVILADNTVDQLNDVTPEWEGRSPADRVLLLYVNDAIIDADQVAMDALVNTFEAIESATDFTTTTAVGKVVVESENNENVQNNVQNQDLINQAKDEVISNPYAGDNGVTPDGDGTTGTSTETETSTGTETDTGTETGTETETDTGTETGTETGTGTPVVFTGFTFSDVYYYGSSSSGTITLENLTANTGHNISTSSFALTGATMGTVSASGSDYTIPVTGATGSTITVRYSNQDVAIVNVPTATGTGTGTGTGVGVVVGM